MKKITLSTEEYIECFLSLANDANEKFKIVKATNKIVVVMVSISFINQYGF